MRPWVLLGNKTAIKKRESDFQRISWASKHLVWHRMFQELYFENSDPAANCLALTHPSLSELVLPGILPVPRKCLGVGIAVTREHAVAVRKQKRITTNPQPDASPKSSSQSISQRKLSRFQPTHEACSLRFEGAEETLHRRCTVLWFENQNPISQKINAMSFRNKHVPQPPKLSKF